MVVSQSNCITKTRYFFVSKCIFFTLKAWFLITEKICLISFKAIPIQVSVICTQITFDFVLLCCFIADFSSVGNIWLCKTSIYVCFIQCTTSVQHIHQNDGTLICILSFLIDFNCPFFRRISHVYCLEN